jgi:hypothetical protein
MERKKSKIENVIYNLSLFGSIQELEFFTSVAVAVDFLSHLLTVLQCLQ